MDNEPIRCQDCGDPINLERLEVIPDTKWCINCADKHTQPYRGLNYFEGKGAVGISLWKDPDGRDMMEEMHGQRGGQRIRRRHGCIEERKF